MERAGVVRRCHNNYSSASAGANPEIYNTVNFKPILLTSKLYLISNQAEKFQSALVARTHLARVGVNRHLRQAVPQSCQTVFL
jgi:hypothetical protein